MLFYHCARSRAAARLHRAIPQQQPSFQVRERITIPFFLVVIKACSSSRDFELGRKIHADAAAADRHTDIYVASSLLDMYAKCGSLLHARAIFDEMPERNVVAWTALIQGSVENGNSVSALELFDRMRSCSCRPNAWTFVAVLKACVSLASECQDHEADPARGARELPAREVDDRHRHLERAAAIHAEARSSGCDRDIFVANTLVELYAKCGSLDRARRVFEAIARPTVVSWTLIITGYVDVGDGAAALELFECMTRIEEPDAQCYVAALKACSLVAEREDCSGSSSSPPLKLLSLDKTRWIHSRVANNIFVHSRLVDAYVRCGSMLEAREVFDTMARHDVIAWTSLIAGYVQNGEPELGLELFSCMKSSGCVPDALAFVAALAACSALAALEIGARIHQELCSRGFQRDGFVANSLVDFYGKCGDMIQAESVFHAMGSSRRTFVTWSSLIAGYSRQGDAQRVFDLFRDMKDAGIEVNGITFLAVLTVCSHAGLVEQGQRFFEAMVTQHGLAPEIEHYHCMADLLGRANHLDEALALVTTVMPFQPTVVTWKTILGACRKWKNVVVGKIAFDNLVKLDPKQDSSYLLMANLYGSLKMWEEQARVLRLRRNSQSLKKPGQSCWTDDQGIVHVFRAGDKSHSQIEAINSKLRAMAIQLKENGYVADLSSVLHNISDGDKEDALCEHSERLAIACALLNTAPGATIRVVKSLRFCDDCHSATATVSKLEKRRIVCRDASRFHVFDNGSCSCNNFW